MPPSRLKWHITKACSYANRLKDLFVVCPFNPLHIVSLFDKDTHMLECQHRLAVDSFTSTVSLPPEHKWRIIWPGICDEDLNHVYIPAPANNKQQYIHSLSRPRRTHAHNPDQRCNDNGLLAPEHSN